MYQHNGLDAMASILFLFAAGYPAALHFRWLFGFSREPQSLHRLLAVLVASMTVFAVSREFLPTLWVSASFLMIVMVPTALVSELINRKLEEQ